MRALARPVRALLGAADAVLATALRALGKRDGDASDGSTPPPLRALPGGATARARRRAEVARAHVVPSDHDRLDDVEIDIGDEDDSADSLLVLPRDPRTIFVTWRRSAATDALRARRIATTTPVVRDALSIEAEDARLSGDGESLASTWIVMLPPLAERTYVDLERPRSVVRVTLGTCGDAGGFRALGDPVPVRLPEHGAAPHRAPRWRTVFGTSPNAASAPPEPSGEVSDRLHAYALAQREPGAGDDRAAIDASPPSTTPRRATDRDVPRAR